MPEEDSVQSRTEKIEIFIWKQDSASKSVGHASMKISKDLYLSLWPHEDYSPGVAEKFGKVTPCPGRLNTYDQDVFAEERESDLTIPLMLTTFTIECVNRQTS